jgi:hypothetical protein
LFEEKTPDNSNKEVLASAKLPPINTCEMMFSFALLAFWTLFPSAATLKLHSFFGSSILPVTTDRIRQRMTIVMRKQKASDKRTSRLQKGLEGEYLSSFFAISTKGSTPSPRNTGVVTSSPMATSMWDYKTIDPISINKESAGRGRARKRAQFYSSLAAYHSEFLNLLTEEYRAEVSSWWRLRMQFQETSWTYLHLTLC